jgi:hypothetical protein
LLRFLAFDATKENLRTKLRKTGNVLLKAFLSINE